MPVYENTIKLNGTIVEGAVRHGASGRGRLKFQTGKTFISTATEQKTNNLPAQLLKAETLYYYTPHTFHLYDS